MRDGEIGKNRESVREGMDWKTERLRGRNIERERGNQREEGRNRERGRRIPAERAREGEASSEGWGWKMRKVWRGGTWQLRVREPTIFNFPTHHHCLAESTRPIPLTKPNQSACDVMPFLHMYWNVSHKGDAASLAKEAAISLSIKWTGEFAFWISSYFRLTCIKYSGTFENSIVIRYLGKYTDIWVLENGCRRI